MVIKKKFNSYDRLDLEIATNEELVNNGIYVEILICTDFETHFSIDDITKGELIDIDKLVSQDMKLFEYIDSVKTKEDAKKYFNFNQVVHWYNPKITDEILQKYRDELKENRFIFQIDEIINKIEIKLNLAQDTKSKTFILKKYISKYSKKLSKNSFFQEYYSIYRKTRIRDNSYHIDQDYFELQKKYLLNNWRLIDDFLCNEYTFKSSEYIELEIDDSEIYGYETIDGFSIYNYTIFKLFIEIEECEEILDFLNNYNNNYSKIGKKIFVSPQSEAILFNAAIELDLLDDNQNAVRGFQSMSSAFWELKPDSKKHTIFKPTARKKDFLIYLNEKYNAGIPNPENGKISSSGNYDLLIKPFI